MEKKPFNPINGRAAKTNDRRTWGTFSQALYRLETGKYHDIGFVFSDEGPFTGTDPDGAVNDDDTARTDRLYRRSGLFVEKWDRPLEEYTMAR
jgi:primase-polymerase (primpol)-like protein